MIGERFGTWTVIDKASSRKAPLGTKTYFVCVCDCGTKREVRRDGLKSGTSSNCGCLNTNALIQRQTTHGLRDCPEYTSWYAMKERCCNPNNIGYERYGGRGIVVCSRWRNSFKNFYADMGPKPSPTHSLDRIDNNSHYSPSNCRWATLAEQARNKRTNNLLTLGDETLCITDWAKRTGIASTTLYARLKRGWSVQQTLETAVWKAKT